MHPKTLHFDEKEHKYTLGNQVLISVSQLISKYKKPFDKSGEIIIRCAQKENITVEELRKRWDYERDSAAERGKNFHKQAEYWVKTGKILDQDYKDVVEKLSKLEFKGKLQSESIIWTEKFGGIAGTVDLIDKYGKNKADILDFKTNKALKMRGFWDRDKRQYQKMLYPINYIEDCNFNHYSIQQELYSIICEENGIWVEEKKILYINPKTRQIDIYPIVPLRKEALLILEHHKNLQDL